MGSLTSPPSLRSHLLPSQPAGPSVVLSPAEELISLDTLDPYELLQAIEAATEGAITTAGQLPTPPMCLEMWILC